MEYKWNSPIWNFHFITMLYSFDLFHCFECLKKHIFCGKAYHITINTEINSIRTYIFIFTNNEIQQLKWAVSTEAKKNNVHSEHWRINCHLQFLFYCFHVKSNKISVKMSKRVGIYVYVREIMRLMYSPDSRLLSCSLFSCVYTPMHTYTQECVCHKLAYVRIGLSWYIKMIQLTWV